MHPSPIPCLHLPVKNIGCAIIVVMCTALASYPQSSCPPTFNEKWTQGTRVYVNLSNITDPEQRRQIELAIQRWGAASAANDSRVTFTLDTPPAGAATLTFQNGSLSPGIGARTDTTINLSTGALLSATITFNPNALTPGGQPVYFPSTPEVPSPGYSTIFLKVALHEIGHTFGLDEAPVPPSGNCDQPDGTSVMNGYCGTNDFYSNMPTEVTECDNNAVNSLYLDPDCPDADGDGWTACAGDCNDLNPAVFNCVGGGGTGGCDSQAEIDCFGMSGMTWDPSSCRCYCDSGLGCSTPVLIDVEGDGFDLTGAKEGVYFDLNRDGVREKLSWTAAGSDDAWLAVDRNGNDTIDDGNELFGNYTEQPAPPSGEDKNGFLALAEFDRPENGGDPNRMIDSGDAIFSSLRLWQDKNHNGVSEVDELHTLGNLGLKSIELDYKESKRTDEHGNKFKYRAKVKDESNARVGRWAWDVYLIPGQ